MARRPWLIGTVTAVLLIGGTPRAVAAGSPEHPGELRRHWSFARQLERLGVKPPAEELPEGTVILRQWYDEVPTASTLPTTGARRSQNIVLIDPKVERLRFGWWKERDYTAGRIVRTLKIWRGAELKTTLTLRLDTGVTAEDMARYLEEGRRLQSEGKLPREDEGLLTVELAGRKWTLPVEAWQKGKLADEDRAWLATVVDEPFAEALRYLNAFAHGTIELHDACLLVTHPLLGITDQPCELAKQPLMMYQDKPDCDFDAWFGEPCSLKDEMDFKLRKNPQLAPPPPQ